MFRTEFAHDMKTFKMTSSEDITKCQLKHMEVLEQLRLTHEGEASSLRKQLEEGQGNSYNRICQLEGEVSGMFLCISCVYIYECMYLCRYVIVI